MLLEPLQDMFTKSALLVLDFSKIPKNTPTELDIRQYFADCERRGENPRLPQNRQRFNSSALVKLESRYLVSQYAENRIAMLSDTPAGKIGRTIHLGMDIFSANLEPVYAPCAGKIVRSGYERGFGEYGNYLILQPKQADYYLFFGHLANNRLGIGPVDNGQVIGHLGDYEDNENGGWSRHLHIQILKQLPPTNETPIGYSTMNDFVTNHNLFPDPLDYFPEWQLQ